MTQNTVCGSSVKIIMRINTLMIISQRLFFKLFNERADIGEYGGVEEIEILILYSKKSVNTDHNFKIQEICL